MAIIAHLGGRSSLCKIILARAMAYFSLISFASRFL